MPTIIKGLLASVAVFMLVADRAAGQAPPGISITATKGPKVDKQWFDFLDLRYFNFVCEGVVTATNSQPVYVNGQPSSQTLYTLLQVKVTPSIGTIVKSVITITDFPNQQAGWKIPAIDVSTTPSGTVLKVDVDVKYVRVDMAYDWSDPRAPKVIKNPQVLETTNAFRVNR